MGWRAGPVALVAGLLALGACGDDPDFSLDRRPESTGPASINRSDARAEARSAGSQEATAVDISLPPTAFEAECASPKPEEARLWSCTVRSRDGRCQGTVEIVAAETGSVVTRRRAIACRP